MDWHRQRLDAAAPGRVDVKSAGAALTVNFMVSLPRSLIVTDGEPQLNSPLQPPSSRRKILIADDNDDAADALGMLLGCLSMMCTSLSGNEAVAAAKERRPDVCIFDIGMPDMNGYELAERVRREAGKNYQTDRTHRLGSGVRQAASGRRRI